MQTQQPETDMQEGTVHDEYKDSSKPDNFIPQSPSNIKQHKTHNSSVSLEPSKSTSNAGKNSSKSTEYEKSITTNSSSELDLSALEGGSVTVCCPKQCQQAGGLCFAFPDWIWNYMYAVIFCIILVFLCIALNFIVPHQSYDLFVSRNGKPINSCMETSRWILYIVCSFMLYIISTILVEIVIWITRESQALLHLSSKSSGRMEYVSGTKRYIILVLFFLTMYICTPYIILDNDPQLRQPVPYATNAALVDTKTAKLLINNSSIPLSDNSTLKATSEQKKSSEKSRSTKILIDAFQTEMMTNYNFAFYWNKFILGLLIFSCFLAIEKFWIQSISVDFHKKAFESRVAALNKRFMALDYLTRIAARGASDPSIYGQVLLDQSHVEITFTRAVPSLNSIELTNADRTKKQMQRLFTDMEAKSTAKMIMNFFAPGKKEITLTDMKPYFRDGEHEMILELFSDQDEPLEDTPDYVTEKNDLNAVTSKQMRNSITKLFQERCDLFSSIHDHGKIVMKFERIITSVTIFISFVVGCLLFQISLKAFLSSVGTFALSFTFIFGPFTKSIFEDFVFILSSHLYDVGDAISIDGEIHTVQKIEILTTTFVRWDGQIVYIPTQQLITKNIMNIRRSGMQTESIELLMTSNTSVESVSKLRKQVSESLSLEKNHFTGKVSLGAFEHSEATVKTRLLIEHGGNFSDMSKKLYRHNSAVQIIKDQVSALGISCSKIQ